MHRQKENVQYHQQLRIGSHLNVCISELKGRIKHPKHNTTQMLVCHK